MGCEYSHTKHYGLADKTLNKGLPEEIFLHPIDQRVHKRVPHLCRNFRVYEGDL
jgi:hypothetical protein